MVNTAVRYLGNMGSEDGTIRIRKVFSGADIYINDVLLSVAPYGKSLYEDYLRRKAGDAWSDTATTSL